MTRAVVGVLRSLGPVLRELREERGVLLIEVAYRLKRSESALSKFERGETIPRNLDEVVAGYAVELGISFSEPWKLAAERANHLGLPLADDDPAPSSNQPDSVETQPETANGQAASAGSD